jgi:hypothetical protein
MTMRKAMVGDKIIVNALLDSVREHMEWSIGRSRKLKSSPSSNSSRRTLSR